VVTVKAEAVSNRSNGSYKALYPQLVGVRGWLVVIIIGIVVSVALNFYLAFAGFADKTVFTASVLATYPALPAFITIRNCVQVIIALGGVLLLLLMVFRRRYVVTFGTVYFAVILAYGILNVFLNYLQFNGNSAVLNAAFKGDGPLRLIAYSSIWLAYFMSSKRLRATFGGAATMSIDALNDEVATAAASEEMPERVEKLGSELDELEQLAFTLDKGCRDDDVKPEDVQKASQYVARVGSEIIDSKAIDAEGYIVYEVQALLAWIDNNEAVARELAQQAAELKGDDVLFTQTANMILRS
jgi:hypothetical protein